MYGEIEFECGHWGVFENAIDMAHIHYLHSDSFGNQDQPKIHGMTATRPSPYHVESEFRYERGVGSRGEGMRALVLGPFATQQRDVSPRPDNHDHLTPSTPIPLCPLPRIHNKPMNKLWEWTNTGDSVPVTAKAMLPSTSAVTIQLAHGVSMITFVNTVRHAPACRCCPPRARPAPRRRRSLPAPLYCRCPVRVRGLRTSTSTRTTTTHSPTPPTHPPTRCPSARPSPSTALP